MTALQPFTVAGWRGQATPSARDIALEIVRLVDSPEGRRSRHARTTAVDLAIGRVFVKVYPAPAARRAWRAFRMGEALAQHGFAVPPVVLIAARGRQGILVTRVAPGVPLLEIASLPRGRKWESLRRLGAAVATLHSAGFVHGDLVPSNVLASGDGFVWLDNDRTRHGRVLVWWGGRRNLVQLGRFVIAGISTTDRMRVFAAYTQRRGISGARRRTLARWIAQKTVARRARIDHLDPNAAAHAGFRQVMRSGGPFDLSASRSVP
jgi:hypothetical protein